METKQQIGHDVNFWIVKDSAKGRREGSLSSASKDMAL